MMLFCMPPFLKFYFFKHVKKKKNIYISFKFENNFFCKSISRKELLRVFSKVEFKEKNNN